MIGLGFLCVVVLSERLLTARIKSQPEQGDERPDSKDHAEGIGDEEENVFHLARAAAASSSERMMSLPQSR
jgi:hypothetical protein